MDLVYQSVSDDILYILLPIVVYREIHLNNAGEATIYGCAANGIMTQTRKVAIGSCFFSCAQLQMTPITCCGFGIRDIY